MPGVVLTIAINHVVQNPFLNQNKEMLTSQEKKRRKAWYLIGWFRNHATINNVSLFFFSEMPCSRRKREEGKVSSVYNSFSETITNRYHSFFPLFYFCSQNSSSSSKTSQLRIVHTPDGDDLYKELTLEGPRKCQSCK